MSKLAPILVVLGILMTFIGLGMSPTSTMTSETCYDDPLGYGQECVQGEVTTSNPTRGWTIGGGILLAIAGIFLFFISSGTRETGRHYTPESSKQNKEIKKPPSIANQDEIDSVHCTECGAENHPDSSYCYKCASEITRGEKKSRQSEEETLSEWAQAEELEEEATEARESYKGSLICACCDGGELDAGENKCTNCGAVYKVVPNGLSKTYLLDEGDSILVGIRLSKTDWNKISSKREELDEDEIIKLAERLERNTSEPNPRSQIVWSIIIASVPAIFGLYLLVRAPETGIAAFWILVMMLGAVSAFGLGIRRYRQARYYQREYK